MKTILLTFVATFFTICGISQNKQAAINKAKLISEALIAENYPNVVQEFTPEVAEKIDADKLEQIWKGITKVYGNLLHTDPIYTDIQKGNLMTVEPFHFEKKILDLKLGFNEDLKVQGVFFTPHTAPKLELRETDTFVEQEIIVKSKNGIKLRGIITLPKLSTKVPVAILVHGSGPNDMDETIGPNTLFKDMAEQFASNGIATVRYDKRTKVYAGKSELSFEELTIEEETIIDALAAVKLSRKHKQIDAKRIYVIGHSLGGMCAPKIASDSKHVKGIVMLGANATPLYEIVAEQMTYLFMQDGTLSEEEESQLNTYDEQLKNLEELSLTNNTSDKVLPLNLPAPYWNSIRNYDQVLTAQNLSKPILIIQGGRDYQVTPREYETWKQKLDNMNNVTFKLFDTLNHLMLEGEGASYPDEYLIESDLPEYFCTYISNWINTNN